MPAPASAATTPTRPDPVPPSSEAPRWHPAIRAATMVALGALAWLPVATAGQLILS